MPENRNWKGRVPVNVILIMSAFWVIYGIAGILGFQVIEVNTEGMTGRKPMFVCWAHRGCCWVSVAVVRSDSGAYGCEYRDRFALYHFACAGHAIHCVYVFYRQKIQKYPEKRVKRHRLMFHGAVFLDLARNRNKIALSEQGCPFCLRSMILTAVFFRPVRKLSLNTERKSDGDAKAAVNFCLSDFADFFLESAAEVTGVPASAPAELPEEPNYVALTFDDGPRRVPPPGCWTASGSGGPTPPSS